MVEKKNKYKRCGQKDYYFDYYQKKLINQYQEINNIRQKHDLEPLNYSFYLYLEEENLIDEELYQKLDKILNDKINHRKRNFKFKIKNIKAQSAKRKFKKQASQAIRNKIVFYQNILKDLRKNNLIFEDRVSKDVDQIIVYFH